MANSPLKMTSQRKTANTLAKSMHLEQESANVQQQAGSNAKDLQIPELSDKDYKCVWNYERQVHKRKRVNRYREEPHLLKKNSKIEFIEVRY